MESDLNQIKGLLQEANILGACDDHNVLALFENLIRCPRDKHLYQLLNDALNPYRLRNSMDPDPLRPYPGEDCGINLGDMELGLIRDTGVPWRINSHTFQHTVVTGPTGGGKTNGLKILMDNLNGVLPFLMVTPKTDMAQLLVDPAIIDGYFQFEEMKLSLFNPPPGEDPQHWHHAVIALFCRVFDLQLSRAHLYEACKILNESYTAYSSANKVSVWFTPTALLDIVKRQRGKYGESLIAALDILCNESYGVFEYAQGYPPETFLVNRSSVLSLNAVKSEKVGRFIVEWFMEWLHVYYRACGPYDGSPQFILMLDDAHQYLSQAHEKNGMMSISQMYLLVRQAGLRFVAVSQYPCDLAPAVLSQSGLVINVGGMAYEKDVNAMAAALGLNYDQKACLPHLGCGEFIARENMGRYTRPFRGTFHLFPASNQPFSNADRRAMMQPLTDRLPSLPAVALDKITNTTPSQFHRTSVPSRVSAGISSDGIALARDVLAHPWDFLRDHYSRLGFSGGKAHKAKLNLVDHGWVREYCVPQQGKSPILLEPLSPLAAGLNQPLPGFGKGGFMHAFIAHCVVTRFKKLNYTNVRQEAFYGSKAVDVVGISPQAELIGVEITCSLGNLVDNLEKDLQANLNFGKIFVICLSMAEIRQAERAIAGASGLVAFRSRIFVEPVSVWL